MTQPTAARTFLLSEVEGLEPFEFVMALPSGRPLHAVEIGRTEEGGLEVVVPGRPPGVPAVEASERGALLERGFVNEEPADPTRRWEHPVADAGEAVELAQQLLVEVFGEKADVDLDVAHGSHRAEHEARQRLGVARERIERVVTEMIGKGPDRDADADFVLPIGEVHVVVAPRAGLDGQVVVRVFAITNVGVDVSNQLGLFLAQLNFGLMFGRFALDAPNKAIWFDETLLGEDFRDEALRFAIRVVASTADEWDDRIKQMFGGATYQEVLAGRTPGVVPPTKPGQGVGQYL